MKRVLVAILAVGLLGCQAGKQEKIELKTQKDKLSYSIGMDIGNRLKGQSIDIDPQILARGVKDALAGGERLLTDDQIRETFMALQKDQRARVEEESKKLGDKNRQAGEAFLAQNKTKEGVKALPSGLQYKVIKEGTGKSPLKTDTVTVHYKGRLLDGTVFDSSEKSGEPVTMPIGHLIPGWQEVLPLMKTGAKWEVYIPSNLAYGDGGQGPGGPGSTLIFEIELVAIK